MKLHVLAMFAQQLAKAATLYGAPRCHHPHMLGLAGSRCRLDGRLHPNQRQLRHGRTQGFHRRSGGRVAGNHQRLDAVLRLQMLGNRVGACLYKGIATLTVGRVAAVCKVDEMFMGQLAAQCLQHAQAANTAVKNANRRGRQSHGATNRVVQITAKYAPVPSPVRPSATTSPCRHMPCRGGGWCIACSGRQLRHGFQIRGQGLNVLV